MTTLWSQNGIIPVRPQQTYVRNASEFCSTLLTVEAACVLLCAHIVLPVKKLKRLSQKAQKIRGLTGVERYSHKYSSAAKIHHYHWNHKYSFVAKIHHYLRCTSWLQNLTFCFKLTSHRAECLDIINYSYSVKRQIQMRACRQMVWIREERAQISPQGLIKLPFRLFSWS